MTESTQPRPPTLRKLDDGHERLFHAAAHVLGVRVTAERPMRVNRRRLLAERGDITYRHEQEDLDDELRRELKRKGWRRASRDKEFRRSAAKSVDIDVAGHLTLTGNLKTHRASGTGDLWLGWQGGDISIFEILDGSVVVLSPREVLAHDDGLGTTLAEVVPLPMVAVRDTTFAWVVSGSGLLATATSGEVIVIDVTDDQPVRVEGGAILAFTDGVEFTAPEDYKRRTALRGFKWLLQFIPRLNLKLEPEPVWMLARGQGTLVVRSRD